MIDLHVHSSVSDGYDDIETIVSNASALGIKALSFVDHDTTETYPIARHIAERYDITVIPGIEISAYDFKRQRKVHVLGYNYQSTEHIDKLCTPLLSRRHQHSLDQLNKIMNSDIEVDEAVINKRLSEGPLYKQHIMSAIIDAPYTDAKYQDLYRRIFKRGIAAGDIEYLDVVDALEAIKQDGGKTVIAHPGQLDSFDIAEELLDTRPGLIDGIEVFHYDHSENDIKRAYKLAQYFNLIETGGSDYHGKFGADYPIGYYTTSRTNFERLNV